MFRVEFLGSRVQGSGCRVQGLGREVQGSRCRVQNVGFRVRVWGSGFRVYASGCGPWVWGVGFVVQSIKLCSITTIVFGRTTPESRRGSLIVNPPTRQLFSKVEIAFKGDFEAIYPLDHSGVVGKVLGVRQAGVPPAHRDKSRE